MPWSRLWPECLARAEHIRDTTPPGRRTTRPLFNRPCSNSSAVSEANEDFWEYAAFGANSLIFLLIGMRLANQDYGFVWMPALIAIALVLAGRALAIYPLS